MFDKELFLSLCRKYDVELSKTAKEPMLREGNDIRPITEEDIKQIFIPKQIYFDYPNVKMDTNIDAQEFYLPDDFAVAC